MPFPIGIVWIPAGKAAKTARKIQGRLPSANARPRFPRLAILLILALVFGTTSLRAHEPSRSYLLLTLESNRFTGRWDIPIRDLQMATPPVATAEGLVDWDRLRQRHAELADYALRHFALTADGVPVKLRVTSREPVVEEFADGPYLEFKLAGEIPDSPQKIEAHYDLFFATNSLHRGLLRLDFGGRKLSAIFSPYHQSEEFEPSTGSGAAFPRFLREGLLHIWTGWDHLLFLLALLLPAVLRREAGHWIEVAALRPAFLNVVKIVTAFTVAHSLTLSLAALGLLRLPTRLTESAIALSVMLAAANNLKPVVRERGWLAAFAFGLVHGFGFASALGELGLTGAALLPGLAGFNLGVEAGQLLLVALFLPVAFALRRTWAYQILALRAGSAVIILVAGIWFAERVFNFKLLPF